MNIFSFKRLTTPIQFILLWGFQLEIIVVILLSFFGYFGKYHLIFELTSHFKLQYLIVGICSLIYFILKRNRQYFIISGICILLNLLEILPWYFPQPNIPNQNFTPVRFMVANVYADNKNYDQIIKLIQEEEPDVVAVLEVREALSQTLEKIQSSFPYSLAEPRNDFKGVALYSKLPLENTAVEFLGTANLPSISANLTLNNQTMSLIVTHPLPPLNSTFLALRNQQLLSVSQKISQLKNPVILLGDLNITMWSPIYKKFIQISGLKNSRKGFGIFPTWPTQFPLLSIPIDHCLVSPELEVLQVKRGQDIGSDHLPLITDIAFD